MPCVFFRLDNKIIISQDPSVFAEADGTADGFSHGFGSKCFSFYPDDDDDDDQISPNCWDDSESLTWENPIQSCSESRDGLPTLKNLILTASPI